jgi:hypothetical protein
MCIARTAAIKGIAWHNRKAAQMSGLDLFRLTRIEEEKARRAEAETTANKALDWILGAALLLGVGWLISTQVGCASTQQKFRAWRDGIDLEEDFKSLLIENIPEVARLLESTTRTTTTRKGSEHTGVQVVKWAKGQERGHVTIEVYDLMPPTDNNKVGPEYYLLVTRGDDIRRGDTMTMAKRGSRDELRHYFTCKDPAYGRKVCASVGSTYPKVWTTLEWEWKPGSMDFRVNGHSAKRSPVKEYAGKIKKMWIPGCGDSRRVFKCRWRHLTIRTPDKPQEGGGTYWEELPPEE